ncbi:acyltransferase [Francisella sp. Scap27]|uniref:acyltransferase family protein n=1 Tax=Francisella sp. Scap27 TaxID=2589986 RepID=UPI0015BFA004|nr:acyltransferase family protein [Francisella sp. Scap27]QLE78807.1 acyltransferase [Francisella sp. Scap27]
MFAFNITIGWKNQSFITKYRRLLISSSILFIISIVYFFYKDNPAYYYFPITRAFELLFGCILAIVVTKKSFFLNRVIANILGVVSLVLMLYPILFLKSQYPSIGAVMACLGATLFMFVGLNCNKNSIVHEFFSIKPLVAIGLISYSLYLWHWPIIAYLNYLGIEKTYVVKLFAFILFIILAIISYFLVEKPFRYGIKARLFKIFLALWVVPIIFACCFALSSKYINNFGFNETVGGFKAVTQRQDGSLVYQYLNWQKNLNNLYEYKSIWAENGYKNDEELKGLINKNYDVVVFGDSHAEVAASMIDEWTKNLKLSTLAVGGTQVIVVYNMIQAKKIDGIINAIIDEARPKYFILVGWWNSYTTHNEYLKNNKSLYFMDNVIKILKKRNVKPIILLDWPSLKGIRPTCGMTRVNTIFTATQACGRSLSAVEKSQNIELKYIRSLQKKYQGLEIIDPKKIVCANGYCSNTVDNSVVYMDSQEMDGLNNAHLNQYGSALIGSLYLKKYGNLLKY